MRLLDWNILIYATLPQHDSLRRLLNAGAFAVSVLSRIEVLGYHRLRFAERAILEQLFSGLLVLPLSDQVVDRAIVVRQQRRISLGDAIIAATALVEGLVLLTHNTSDLDWIEGLAVVDPV